MTASGIPTPPAGDGRLRRTLAGAALLGVVMAGLVTVAMVVWAGHDPDRRLAVGVAGGVSAAASLAGWWVARLGAGDPALAVSRSLGGILIRLMPPLALLGWLTESPWSPPVADRLREAGAGGLLVAFYLAMLATDILLHIMWGPRGTSGRPSPAVAPADAAAGSVARSAPRAGSDPS